MLCLILLDGLYKLGAGKTGINILKNNNLRFKLRNETQEAHNRLDAALVAHDLTTISGLRAYLCVHFLAGTHMQNLLCGYDFLRDDAEKLAFLRADFEIMGGTPPSWPDAPRAKECHAVGLIYVMAGSALGSKLLYKTWRTASDDDVLSVHNFMTYAKDSKIWHKFLDYTENTLFSESEVESMVEAANYCFGIFEAANNQVLKGLRDV